jgi:hypothetical protein
MGEAIESMDKIKRRFDCSVVAVHHTGKSVDKGLRGHSSLIGALDSSLQVDKEENFITLRMDKQKDDEEIGEQWFSLNKIEFTASPLGDVESSLVLERSSRESSGRSKLKPAERRVYDALIRAIDKSGKISGDFSWKWVSEDEWREVAFSSSISTGGIESQRRAFRRNADKLLERGMVAKDENRVWSVEMAKRTPDRPDSTGQK